MASFQSRGILPVCKERLYRTAKEGASSAAASFRSRVGMPSCTGLFLVLSCLTRESTSAGEVVMVYNVEVISGVVRIGGVVGGLSATEFSLCWMKKRLSIFALSCGVVASCGG